MVGIVQGYVSHNQRVYVYNVYIYIVHTHHFPGVSHCTSTSGDLFQEKRIARVSKFMIPSGKRLHSYGKSLILMGKSTINGHFQ